MAEFPYWVNDIRTIMRADQERGGQSVEEARVLSRSPGGGVTIDRRGATMDGVHLSDGREVRAGDTVMVARFGRYGHMPMVIGDAPVERTGTEAQQVRTIDVGTGPLLGRV